MPTETRERLARVLPLWKHQDEESRPIVVVQGDHLQAFRRAASFFNGQESFLVAVQSFSEGSMFLVPLEVDDVSPWVCSFNPRKSWCSEDEAALAMLTEFRSKVDGQELRKSLQAKKPPVEPYGFAAVTLPGFVQKVLLGTTPSLVLFVTDSCPVCPPAVELLRAVHEISGTSLHCCCFNVAQNDIPASGELTADERDKECNIPRVPLFRYYSGVRADAPLTFEGERTLESLLTFVATCDASATSANVKLVNPNVKRPRDT